MKCKILVPFVDKYTHQRYDVGDVVEFTVERAAEIEATQGEQFADLGAFLEPIQDEPVKKAGRKKKEESADKSE